jgi:hypothetical protein
MLRSTTRIGEFLRVLPVYDLDDEVQDSLFIKGASR